MDQPESTSEQRGFWRKFLSGATITNWLVAIATVCIAVATGIYTHYAKGQLGVMVGQLKAMDDAGMQTNKLIEEATKQSKAARDSADASALIAENAKKSIEVTQNNIRLDQRAWVGPVEAIMPTSAEGPEPHLGVKIINSGKTPARNVQAGIST